MIPPLRFRPARPNTIIQTSTALLCGALLCCNPEPFPSPDEAEPLPSIGEVRQSLLARLKTMRASGRSELDDTTVAAMWRPAEPVESLEATIPDEGFLDTAFAVDPAAARLLEGSYRVAIGLTDQDGTYREILQRTIATAESGAWYPVNLDLGRWSGKTVALAFSKRYVGEPGAALEEFEIPPIDLLVWKKPVIRPRRLPSPNIILISLDTLRADHLGVNGHFRDTTPNIDRLAREGVNFTECIAQAPWTMPSHYSILSGTIPSTGGATSPVQSMTPPNGSVTMLAERLRSAGYLTAAFTGKGAVSADYGFDRGFDTYAETGLVGGSDVETIVEKASRWIRSNEDRSFFLFLHSYEPHEPFIDEHFVDEEGIESFEDEIVAKYDGDIRRADRHLGSLIELLGRRGLDRSTVVVFTSDHGKEFFENRVPEFDSFAEHGHTLYDEQLHVPLVMRGPGLPAGRAVASQARSIDIVPTILELLDLDDDISSIEGTSLLPWVNGEKSDDLIAFSEATTFGPARESLRDGTYKFIRRTGYGQLSHPSSRNYPMTPREELYDLEADPQEKTSLVSQDPAILLRLREEIARIGGEVEQQPDSGSQSGRAVDAETREALRSLGYIQ